MKKTLLIGLAFVLGTWAASYMGKAPPKLEANQPAATASTGAQGTSTQLASR